MISRTLRNLRLGAAALLAVLLLCASPVRAAGAAAPAEWAGPAYIVTGVGDRPLILDGTAPAPDFSGYPLAVVGEGQNRDLAAAVPQPVTVRCRGGVYTSARGQEPFAELLRGFGAAPGPGEGVLVTAALGHIELTVSSELTYYDADLEQSYYQTVRRENPALKPGEERVVQVGRPGERGVVYEVEWSNGAVIARHMVELLNSAPVDEIIEYGPAKAPEKAPAKAPAETPAKTPTEIPVKAPAETPVKAPTEIPVKAPTEIPVKAPAETPVKTPTEIPVKAPAKTPAKTPTEIPVKAPTEIPVKTPTEIPVKTPTEIPVKTPAETPAKAPAETSAKAPAETPAKAPADPSSGFVSVSRDADQKGGVLTLPSGETLRFSKSVSMTATAYTTGYDGVGTITASGTTVHVGVVAVDPKVIPLGTRLYIIANGGVVYGKAVAEDTGVRGNCVDLYMNTYRQCINFGRRSCMVYILE